MVRPLPVDADYVGLNGNANCDVPATIVPKRRNRKVAEHRRAGREAVRRLVLNARRA
jgi:hypothetical protein